MTDPLNDPNFPDRPTHVDFWRLSEVVLKLDGKVTEGEEEFEDVYADIIDFESLLYMALMRTRRAFPELDSDELRSALLSAFMTAFAAGVEFERAGGRQHVD